MSVPAQFALALFRESTERQRMRFSSINVCLKNYHRDDWPVAARCSLFFGVRARNEATKAIDLSTMVHLREFVRTTVILSSCAC